MILLDGDVVVYRCGFAVEKTKYLVNTGSEFVEYDNAKSAKEDAEGGGVIWSRKEVEPEENALFLVRQVVEDLCNRYADTRGHLAIYLSPSVGNFRDALATRTKYKGNRESTARPYHYKAIRQYLLEHYGAVVAEGCEADDKLAEGMHNHPDSVIVSIDKDLLSVPGLHYNWVSKEERLVTKREAALNFWAQVLSGDPADNVLGIEGIGPAKAKKLLAGVKNDKDAWEVVKTAYIQAYGDDGLKFAKETAHLVYLRRGPNDVWKPPA